MENGGVQEDEKKKGKGKGKGNVRVRVQESGGGGQKRDSVHAQEKASAISLLTKVTNFSTDAVIARNALISAQENAVLTKNADVNPANNAGDIPNTKAMFL